MANNIDLTICAPKPSFRRFRCSAWLIFQKKHTVLFLPKRSCSRFASLTLRTPHRPPVSLCFSGRLIFCLRTEPALRAAPVFRMAYFSEKHTVLFLPKRSCFRFASLTLRTAHRPIVSLCFSPKRTTSRFASLTLRLRTETFFQKVPVFRMAYSAPTAHCAVSSETLMLQVRSAHPPMPHRTSSLSCSGVPVGLFGKPKRSTFRFAPLTLRTALARRPHLIPAQSKTG